MYNIEPQELIYMGRKIQARRKEMGLTQEQLAEKIGCSITHLCRIEGGSKPGLDALLRLSRVLGYSLDELLGIYPPDNPVLQETLNCILSRPVREQYLALQTIEQLFLTIDRLWDPEENFVP